MRRFLSRMLRKRMMISETGNASFFIQFTCCVLIIIHASSIFQDIHRTFINFYYVEITLLFWFTVKCFLGYVVDGQEIQSFGTSLRHYVCKAGFVLNMIFYFPWSSVIGKILMKFNILDAPFVSDCIHSLLVFSFSFYMTRGVVVNRLRELGVLGDFSVLSWIKAIAIILLMSYCGIMTEMFSTLFFQTMWKIVQQCPSITMENKRLNNLSFPTSEKHQCQFPSFLEIFTMSGVRFLPRGDANGSFRFIIPPISGTQLERRLIFSWVTEIARGVGYGRIWLPQQSAMIFHFQYVVMISGAVYFFGIFPGLINTFVLVLHHTNGFYEDKKKNFRLYVQQMEPDKKKRSAEIRRVNHHLRHLCWLTLRNYVDIEGGFSQDNLKASVTQDWIAKRASTLAKASIFFKGDCRSTGRSKMTPAAQRFDPRVVGLLHKKVFLEGETIFAADGRACPFLYWVTVGKVRLNFPNGFVSYLTPGSIFGETNFTVSFVPPYVITAASEATLLTLRRSHVERLPGIRERLISIRKATLARLLAAERGEAEMRKAEKKKRMVTSRLTLTPRCHPVERDSVVDLVWQGFVALVALFANVLFFVDNNHPTFFFCHAFFNIKYSWVFTALSVFNVLVMGLDCVRGCFFYYICRGHNYRGSLCCDFFASFMPNLKIMCQSNYWIDKWHHRFSHYIFAQLLYIAYTLIVICHFVFKLAQTSDTHRAVCLAFYRNLLAGLNMSTLVDNLYVDCGRVAQLDDNVTAAVEAAIASCRNWERDEDYDYNYDYDYDYLDYNGSSVTGHGDLEEHYHGKYTRSTLNSEHHVLSDYIPAHVPICERVKEFAKPFHRLCRSCTKESEPTDYLLDMFFYLSGATTVGYTSVVEYWNVDHVFHMDFEHSFSIFTSFCGIMLMAIMEALFMFHLVEELRPMQWADNHITSLQKMILQETRWRAEKNNASTITDASDAELIETMSQQLHLTFVESHGKDMLSNQKSVNAMRIVDPEYETMPTVKMLKYISTLWFVDKEDLMGLMGYGHTLTVVPGFHLFFKGDLLRDIMVIIDGYVEYDSMDRRMLASHSASNVFGPGEILNCMGYLTGHAKRHVKARTFVQVLVITSSTIDKLLADSSKAYKYFQRLAFRALELDFATAKQVTNDKQENEEGRTIRNVNLSACKRRWSSEKCALWKYGFLTMIHFFNMMICLLWIGTKELYICFEETYVKESRTDTEEKFLENLESRVNTINYIKVITDVVTITTEFVFFSTQIYYTKEGVFVDQYRFTLYNSFVKQLVHWMLACMPMENIFPHFRYSHILALNRLMSFWRMYAFKHWLLYRFPSHIKLISFVWVICLYTVSLHLFTCMILFGAEITCDPKDVITLMICRDYTQDGVKLFPSVHSHKYAEVSKQLDTVPFKNPTFLNSSDCWMPDRSAESPQACQALYQKFKRRYWTFTMKAPYFGEDRRWCVAVLKNGTIAQLYLTCLYYVTQTITMTGFGDFTIYSQSQFIFFAFLIVISFFLNSYMSVHFLAPHLEDNKALEDHRDKMARQLQYLKDKNVPDYLASALSNYVNTTFLNISSLEQFVCEAPDLLLRELKYLAFHKTLRRSRLFQQEPDSHDDLIVMLSEIMHPLYLPQNASVIRRGDVADMIYLLGKGSLRKEKRSTDASVFSEDSDEIFGDLEEGLSFWTWTVTTTTPAFFLVVSKVHVLQILHKYPVAKRTLKMLFSSLPDYCCHAHHSRSNNSAGTVGEPKFDFGSIFQYSDYLESSGHSLSLDTTKSSGYVLTGKSTKDHVDLDSEDNVTASRLVPREPTTKEPNRGLHEDTKAATLHSFHAGDVKRQATTKETFAKAHAAHPAAGPDIAASRCRTLSPTKYKLRVFLIFAALLKLKQMQLCIFQILHVQSLHDPFINHIYFLDLVFLAEIIIRFRMGFFDVKTGEMVMTPSRIRRHYASPRNILSSDGGFLLDLVSIAPFHIALRFIKFRWRHELVAGLFVAQMLPWCLKVVRALVFLEIFAATRASKWVYHHAGTRILKLRRLHSIVRHGVILMGPTLLCVEIWCLTGCSIMDLPNPTRCPKGSWMIQRLSFSGDGRPGNFSGANNPIGHVSDTVYLYYESFYFVLNVLTATGIGDIHPGTALEMRVGIFMMLGLRLIAMNVLSKIITTTMAAALRSFKNKKILAALWVFNKCNVSKQIMKKFIHDQRYRRSYYSSNTLQSLVTNCVHLATLREDICFCVCEPFLRRLRILHGLPLGVVKLISICVLEELHDLDAIVIEEGALVDSVLYVVRGFAETFTLGRKGKRRILSEGDLWGVDNFEGRRLRANETLVAGQKLVVYRLSSSSVINYLEGRLDIYSSALGRL